MAYVPQSLLLPKCAAVICHAGAGTVLGALAAGLPLLLLPQGADQYVVADLVAAAGAGLKLAPAEGGPAPDTSMRPMKEVPPLTTERVAVTIPPVIATFQSHSFRAFERTLARLLQTSQAMPMSRVLCTA